MTPAGDPPSIKPDAHAPAVPSPATAALRRDAADDPHAAASPPPGAPLRSLETSPAEVPGPRAAGADLIRRLQAGEEAAFEDLVRSTAGRLLAVARRMTPTEADAEDALQEAYLSAFRSIHGFDGRSSLSTWLHRIVVNAALTRARKAKRAVPSVSTSAAVDGADGERASPGGSEAGARPATVRAPREQSIEDLLPQFEDGHFADRQVRWRDVTSGGGVSIEVREAIERALRELPDAFRAVIVLKDVEGYESRQIATALGISDALVRQRLHRGRQALMKLLAPMMAAMEEGQP